MATPTITTVGAASGLLLITDDEGVAYRVPKINVCEIIDSSNADVYRLEICHAKGAIVLIYASAAEVAATLVTLDALY